MALVCARVFFFLLNSHICLWWFPSEIIFLFLQTHFPGFKLTFLYNNNNNMYNKISKPLSSHQPPILAVTHANEAYNLSHRDSTLPFWLCTWLHFPFGILILRITLNKSRYFSTFIGNLAVQPRHAYNVTISPPVFSLQSFIVHLWSYYKTRSIS